MSSRIRYLAEYGGTFYRGSRRVLEALEAIVGRPLGVRPTMMRKDQIIRQAARITPASGLTVWIFRVPRRCRASRNEYLQIIQQHGGRRGRKQE